MHRRTLLFLTFIAAYPLWTYLVLFLGMIIEGDVLLFTAGFLVHRGVLKLLPTFFAMYAGTVFGDVIWYGIGTIDPNRNKIVHFLAMLADVASRKIDEHLKERTFRTLLISKYVYGAHHFVLARAGMLRLPLRRFLRDDALGSLIWILSLGILGYAASASFSRVAHGLRLVEIILLLSIVIFVLLHEVLSKILKNKL
jgi:membrane protein DedA with SNARE-associated domain